MAHRKEHRGSQSCNLIRAFLSPKNERQGRREGCLLSLMTSLIISLDSREHWAVFFIP